MTRGALALLSVMSFAELHAEQPRTGLSVGTVIASNPGQTVDGWIHVGSGLIVESSTSNLVTTDTLRCCFAVFERKQALLIARTRPTVRDAKGGVLRERIEQVLKVQKQPGETSLANCSAPGTSSVWTLLNERTRVARSFVMTNRAIEQLSWIDLHHNCEDGE